MVYLAVQARMGTAFPYGTLLINLTGCFLLALIGQLTLNRMLVSSDLRLAIAVGFFGGYTNFLQFRLGNGETSGDRLMAACQHLRRSKRFRRGAALGSRHSSGKIGSSILITSTFETRFVRTP